MAARQTASTVRGDVWAGSGRLPLRRAARHVCLIALAGGVLALHAAAGQPAAPPAADGASVAPAQGAPVATVTQRAAFRVSRLDARYVPEPHPGLPPMEDLLERARVAVVSGADGWYVPDAEHVAAEPVSVAELNRRLSAAEGGSLFSKEAVVAVLVALRDALVAEDLIGVLAEVDADQIEQDADTLEWTDLREEGATELGLNVFAATVTRVRTIAAGSRLRDQRQRIDLPEHEAVRANSPLAPAGAEGEERFDLLRRGPLDDYVLRLNRRAGRRVDVAISGDDPDRPGSVLLDYLVREADPLLVYVQGSNTGTKQTEVWRERAGLIHNQLTGHNDVLSLDYVTGGFEQTHIFNGSYEIPLDAQERLKARVSGSYSQFDASEVGRSNERFSGDAWFAGGEISLNVLQVREVFVDLFAGAKFQSVFVENNTNPLQPVRGETDFVLPIIGARLERLTDEGNTVISLAYEANLPELADTSAAELQRLGRLNTDRDWQTVQFSAEQTLFLEPLLDRDAFVRGDSTLAHELAFTFKGQTAFGYRLAPNFQQVAGGLYTVRGYPESAASGDTVYVGTVEYRLHVPRLFAVAQEPGSFLGEPFRWAPQQAYGRPDWDLVLRGFVDAARTENNQAAVNEFDQSLLSAGFGFEVQFRRNLNVRVDYGFVLEGLEGSTSVERGDGRIHFVGTLLF